MKLLLASGRPVPPLFNNPFAWVSLRRIIPLAALIAAGAMQAIAPASALQMTSRVGFQLPDVTALQTPAKNGGDQLLGIFCPGACAPLTLTIDGPETGDAQALVTAKVGARSIAYTRALHLTGAAQTVRFTLSGAVTGPDNFGYAPTLSIQILQDGRSLAQQENHLPTNMAQSRSNVLGLTNDAGRLSRSLHDYALTMAQGNAAKAAGNMPRQLIAPSDSLPDSAQAYEAINAVVLDYSYPLETASPDQQAALQEYVRQGGRLILIGASCITGTTTKTTALRNNLAGLQWNPAADANAAGSGIRAAIDGAGVVFFAPEGDIAQALAGRENHIRDYRVAGHQWKYLLGTTETMLFSPRQAPAYNSTPNNNYYRSSELMDALAGQQAAQTVPFPLITGFLLTYIILIIPVNYLVLKKLDRRELAWITAPVLVFLFSGVSYAVAHAIKGGNLTVNRAVVYEGFANTDTIAGRGQFTLYSPRRAAYNISIGDAKDSRNPYRNIQPTETLRSERANGASDLTVARDASTSLRNVNVPLWDTRSFDIPVTGSLGGGIEARVSLSGSDLRYRLTNHTKYDLHHCSVIVGDQNVPMSDLKAGETAEIHPAWTGNIATNSPFARLPITTMMRSNQSAFSLHPAEATAAETQEAIREALESSLRTIYVDHYISNSYNDNFTPSNRTVIACGFLGWFDAKTLDVQVDGKSAEGEQENMLYVHLPLPRNTETSQVGHDAMLRLIPNVDAASTNAKTINLENPDAK